MKSVIKLFKYNPYFLSQFFLNVKETDKRQEQHFVLVWVVVALFLCFILTIPPCYDKLLCQMIVFIQIASVSFSCKTARWQKQIQIK